MSPGHALAMVLCALTVGILWHLSLAVVCILATVLPVLASTPQGLALLVLAVVVTVWPVGR